MNERVPKLLPEPGVFRIKVGVEGDVSLKIFIHALFVGDHLTNNLK